jgi:hypothetical protein
MSSLDVSNAMAKQWTTYRVMRSSWMLALCESAKTAEDFVLCCEAWRVFQARIEFTDSETHGFAFMQAAIRTRQFKPFFALLLAGTYRVKLSSNHLARLLTAAPDELVVAAWRVVLQRHLPAQPPARVFRVAIHRCAHSPALAPLVAALVEQYTAAGHAMVPAVEYCVLLAETLQGNFVHHL